MNRMEERKEKISMAAGILQLLGLLIYAGVAGEHGAGYFACAFECFFLLLLVTAYSLPEVLAKLIRARLQKGQNHNGFRVLKAALLVGLLYGILGSLLFGGLTEGLLKLLFKTTYGSLTLRLFVPGYILFLACQILCGFFQGMGSAVPTMVAKLMKSVIWIVSGLIFCRMFQNYGQKADALLSSQEFAPMYSGAGLAVGFDVAVLFAVLFLFFVYLTNRKNMRLSGRESLRLSERVPGLALLILQSGIWTSLYAGLLRLPVLCTLVAQMRLKGMDISLKSGLCGAVYGKYFAMVTGFVLLFSLAVTGIKGETAVAWKREEYKTARRKFSAGFHYLWIHSLFGMMFVMVLGDGIMKVFYKNDSGQAGEFLAQGGWLIPAVTLLLFTTGILLEMGHIRFVLASLLAGDLLYMVFLWMNASFFHRGMQGNVIFLCVCMTVVSCINGFWCVRTLKWKPQWLYHFVFPVGTAAVSGLLMFLLHKAFVSVLGQGISSILCGLVGLGANFILLLASRGIREEELEAWPLGGLLIRFGRRIHLL